MKLHVLDIVRTLLGLNTIFRLCLIVVWIDSFGCHALKYPFIAITPLSFYLPTLVHITIAYTLPCLVRAIFALPLLTVSCLLVRLNYCIKSV
jgi:hypothetical protein